jgi:cation diffusion facilitator CzcD-associated flavoprotein CzcO
MPETQAATQTSESTAADQFDVIIIGGGISGMYQLYRLREMGLSVQVYESGSDVGGTWYWNRYPGCRFDSESYSYGYSFSEELLEEWDWSEHFAGQPETLRYLNHVADKFDLRKNMRFNSKVETMTFDDVANTWTIETEDGIRAEAPILITAIGMLTAPNMPNFEGVDSFEGVSFHTARTPHAEDGFSGKYQDVTGLRVGVVGTGATGVQVIQEMAKTADELFVFQMVPEYCAPLLNSPIDDETQKEIKASYPEIFKKCRESFGSFMHTFDPRSALEVTPEEREALFEKLYAEPGFGIWLGTFQDTLRDEKANAFLTEFIKKKIRSRVNDPELAEKLIPTTYGFGTRRVPMETNYYEVYNQDNVHLVDVGETPIERITPKGIQVDGKEYELDLIIYATGFDAVTGAFKHIDIRGKGGQKLLDKWEDGPKNYLGMQPAGFPNMFTLVGPHNGSTFCNIPRCIEQNVEWVTGLIKYMQDHKYTVVETSDEAADGWADHVADVANATLFPKANSWIMGDNVKGKKRGFLLYPGGGPVYRAKCEDVAAKDYEGFEFH